MKGIKILDCTLRDGGYVNNWEFGEAIQPIICSLEKSHVDYIELGFLRDGEYGRNQTIYNYVHEANRHVENISRGNFSLMIRPDWYDISKFNEKADKINLIRFAFYMKDKELTYRQVKHVRELGYKVSLNPVNICSYSDEELLELLDFINKVQPELLMIVDTFGSLTVDKFEKIYKLFDSKVDTNVAIGAHLHENMLLSSAIVAKFLEIKNDNRESFIDGSLNGIGRIPGNLPIEILIDIINSYRGEDAYDISSILYAIDNYIYPIKEKHYWGYSPAYYWSGKLQVHRTYPEYYLEKKNLDVCTIVKLLKEIAMTDKKWGFDESYANSLLND